MYRAINDSIPLSVNFGPEHILIDIGTTKKFPITPFSVYVALSQSRGQYSVRLLRDFDNTTYIHEALFRGLKERG
jgi:hypothetical protein